MKQSYRGFDIDVHRGKSMGGDTLLYYSVFRQSDGWEMTSGFHTGSDTVRDFVRYMKDHVDDAITNPSDWEDPSAETQTPGTLRP